jgi:type I restriction enzyme, S subunit
MHICKLSDYFEITSSKRVFKSEWTQDGIPFYRAREIVKISKDEKFKDPIFISNNHYQELAKKYGVPKIGDLLVTGVGTLGISLIIENEKPFYFKDGNIIWFKKKEEINSKYVQHYLNSPIVQKIINNKIGATVKTLTISDANNLQIPVPSLQEQEKIVERLDKVFENIDHKISIYEDEVKGIDKLFNSTIHSIFVQGEDGYSEVFLKDIAEYFNGLTYSPTDKSDSGTLVLRSSNVQNNELDFKDIVRVSKNIKEKLFVQNGDVLICSRNGSKRLIGKSAEIKDLPEPMTFGTFMMIVRSDKNNYLKWFFKSSVFKQQISSGENTMINQITRYMLDEIKLQLPNEKVQKEIDNKLTKLYKACEDLRQNINLKLYKAALLKKTILNKDFTYE